jgi:hypothetical protein
MNSIFSFLLSVKYKNISVPHLISPYGAESMFFVDELSSSLSLQLYIEQIFFS